MATKMTVQFNLFGGNDLNAAQHANMPPYLFTCLNVASANNQTSVVLYITSAFTQQAQQVKWWMMCNHYFASAD